MTPPVAHTPAADETHRKILMTCALPYANGYIHIGHLVEYLQADFWARFQKMRGNECVYICADDTHGTPIMVKARELKITPEQLIAKSYDEHLKDFSDFQIEFDHYGSTNSEENRKLSEQFYAKFQEAGLIRFKKIQQLYCEHDKMFLPDRFVKGSCPSCGAADQYGDSCDVCGSTYSPSDLKNVYCSVCRNAPVLKDSESIFFHLNHYKSYLEAWIHQHVAPDVARKMLEWFKEDLLDLDISRAAPYFGFPIPGTNNEKYFYVWVDAPMGYMSSTEQWAKKRGQSLKDIWDDPKREIYHFIGKDIARFHTIFWPSFLKTAGFRDPSYVFVHGHLMVNGEKMSKSKGTFVAARTYLDHLNPEYLRFYYSTKLNGTSEDIDLNMDDFVSRVNSDLIGKITNLGSRGAQMLTKKMDGALSEPDTHGHELIRRAQALSEEIAGHYEDRDFSKAMTAIRGIADEANKYFDEKAPWKTLESHPEETKAVITTTLNLFRIITIYMKPVLPKYSERVEKLLNEKPYQWADAQKTLEKVKINNFEHLAVRIESDNVKAMVAASAKLNEEVRKTSAPAAAPAKAVAAKSESTTPGVIDFADFEKVQLKIGKVVAAEEIKEADKLLRLQIDIGEEKPRQVIAGIKSAYSAEKLLGRHLLVCTNLAPRKMKFGVSEGMVLAASGPNSESGLFVLSPDEGAQAGFRVK